MSKVTLALRRKPLSEHHTVLPATRHRWMRPALSIFRQAVTRLNYPEVMLGWADLGGFVTYLLTKSHCFRYRLTAHHYGDVAGPMRKQQSLRPAYDVQVSIRRSDITPSFPGPSLPLPLPLSAVRIQIAITYHALEGREGPVSFNLADAACMDRAFDRETVSEWISDCSQRTAGLSSVVCHTLVNCSTSPSVCDRPVQPVSKNLPLSLDAFWTLFFNGWLF